MLIAVLSGALLLAARATPQAEVVRLTAQRDNTLIEDPAGAFSNGGGPVFFVGRTNQPAQSKRRGLLRFELEGALPDDAVIEDVKLILHASAANGPNRIRVHRLSEDWGEGSSASTGGQGAPSQPGDATWLHTFFDQELWLAPGATDRLARASAVTTLGSSSLVVWKSPGLRRDVEAWRLAPERNFGWVLIGDELGSQTVTRFDSRENANPAFRPVLEVTYRRDRARR